MYAYQMVQMFVIDFYFASKVRVGKLLCPYEEDIYRVYLVIIAIFQDFPL